jgi:cytochrome c biogenesis protein CcmG/thiol:disulfide interchange protein DsbE
MSGPSVKENSKRRDPPLWVKIGSFILASTFVAFLIIILDRVNFSPLKIGDQAPDFTLTTFEGNTVKLRDLRGKTVLINFWASWCTECQDEAKVLETVWQENQASGRVIFIGVDYADTATEARQFIQANELNFVNGPDLGSKISGFFDVSGVPETYLINEQGRLVNVKIGPFTSVDELRTFLQKK